MYDNILCVIIYCVFILAGCTGVYEKSVQVWKPRGALFFDQLPAPLLHAAFEVVLDSLLSLHGNVLHSLSCTAGNLITASTRPEWLPIATSQHDYAPCHTETEKAGI